MMIVVVRIQVQKITDTRRALVEERLLQKKKRLDAI